MKLNFADSAIQLKAIQPGDEAILSQIYASTRVEELAQLTDWTSIQKEAFLHSQFLAQHTFYQNNYLGAYFWLIKYNNVVIGRLYLHPFYQMESVRIIDISILTQWRNRGIGKQVISSVLKYASGLNRAVTIHVESFNPAMQLYKALGFQLLSHTNGVYHLLQWTPSVLEKKSNSQKEKSEQWQ